MSSKSQKCRHNAESSAETCQACKTERRSQLKYRWKIILGLFLPFAISALDVTIIASALPWIADDFGELSQLNWIISSFNLTAAAFIPFWGQMADIWGRHASIQACMITAIIGGTLCTGAPTRAFPMLLLGRALQGIGCAGINVVVRAIVADKVSLQEDAKNWSIFSVVGGISYGVGPIIGGYLTNTNWRWCFGITLPVGVAGCIITFIVLRKELLGPQPIPRLDETAETGRKTTFKHRLRTVDVGGQILSLFGIGLMILALTWAGSTYAWDSPAIIVPLAFGVLITCVFMLWQYYMAPDKRLAKRFPQQQAMIPWEVISNRDIGLLFYISFAAGMAMYSVLYFCTLYFTMVKQQEPSEAGRQLLYFVPGLGTGVWIAIIMCNYHPLQTWHPIMLGGIIEAVGIAVLTWALWKEHDPTVYGMMVLTGVGIGVRLVPVPLHGMAYFPKRIAAVISLMEVSDPFGGTLGLTIMTTVLNNVAGVGDLGDSNYDFSELPDVGKDEIEDLKNRAKKGIVLAFVAIFPFMILCIVASAFLGNVYISTDSPDEDEQSNTIFQGVFLWSWLRRKRIDENPELVTTTRRAAWTSEPGVLPQASDGVKGSITEVGSDQRPELT
ncbi:hypothetical protein FDECE_16856 [Fusarium decemcellulare]|nr:hypothetical protein FDECE_16856 [Fusarium decemcellulare]